MNVTEVSSYRSSFPTDTLMRSRWISAVNRVDPESGKIWLPGPTAVLCSRHFQKSDFEIHGVRRKLRKDAMPSVYLHEVLPLGVSRAEVSPALQSQDGPRHSWDWSTEMQIIDAHMERLLADRKNKDGNGLRTQAFVKDETAFIILFEIITFVSSSQSYYVLWPKICLILALWSEE